MWLASFFLLKNIQATVIVSGFAPCKQKHVCQIQPGGFRHAMCRMLFGIFRLHVVKMTVELYQKHKNNAFALSTV